jgi:hypothetical protein
LRLQDVLVDMGISCGRLHNPSARIDPGYWRFYVLARSHQEFLSRIGSWHPRKRLFLSPRTKRECNKVAVRERAAGSPPF